MKAITVGIGFKIAGGRAVKTLKDMATKVKAVSISALKAGTSLKTYTNAYQHLKGRLGNAINFTKRWIAKLRAAGDKAGDAGGKISGLTSKLKNLAAVGIIGIGISTGVGSVVDSLKKVELAQASLRATADLDKGSKGYEALDAKAEKLAASTQFSKEQILGAMDAMASEGQSVSQILTGIRAVTMSSAASMGDVDLVQSAKNLNGALGAFQKNAGESTKIVDMFARATQVTSLKMVDLKNVARDTAIGAGMNQDFGTMVAMQGMLKQIAGSTEVAGTQVKGFARSINAVKANPDTINGLKKYGIELFDKNTGKAKNFVTIVNDIEGNLNKLNDPFKKAAILKKVFTDSEAMAAYNNIVTLGTDKWKEKAKAINTANGVAAKSEKEYLDTAVGKIELLKSAWDAFTRNFLAALTPAIKFVADSFSALLSDTTVETPGWIVGLKMGFQALNPMIQGVKSVIVDLFGSISGSSSMETMVITLANGEKVSKNIPSIFLSIKSAIETVTPVLITVATYAAEFIKFLVEWNIPQVVIGVLALAKGIAIVKGVVAALTVGLKLLMASNPFTLIAMAVVGFAILIYTNWDKIKTYTVLLWNGIKNYFSQFMDFVKNIFKKGWESGIIPILLGPVGLVIRYWSQIKTFFFNTVNFVKQIFIKGWQSGVIPIILGPVGLVIRYWSQIKTFFSNLISNVVNRFNRGKAFIINSFLSLKIRAVQIFKGFLNYILGMPKKIISGFKNVGLGMMNTIASGIKKFAGKAINTVKSLVSKIREYLPFSPAKKGPLADLNKVGPGFINSIVGGIKKYASRAYETVKGVVGKIRKYLPFSPAKEGPLADLGKVGPGFINTIAVGIKSHSQTLKDAVKSSVTGLEPKIAFKAHTITETSIPKVGRGKIDPEGRGGFPDPKGGPQQLVKVQGNNGGNTYIEKVVINIGGKEVEVNSNQAGFDDLKRGLNLILQEVAEED